MSETEALIAGWGLLAALIGLAAAFVTGRDGD